MSEKNGQRPTGQNPHFSWRMAVGRRTPNIVSSKLTREYDILTFNVFFYLATDFTCFILLIISV